jgi:hypothetical protein
MNVSLPSSSRSRSGDGAVAASCLAHSGTLVARCSFGQRLGNTIQADGYAGAHAAPTRFLAYAWRLHVRTEMGRISRGVDG